MKTFIKTILALSMLGVIFSCDGGGNLENEKNKQDIAALSNQLTELEDICTDLQSTIDLLNKELKTMNSADAAKVEEAIKQMKEKLESIEEFKADFESKIEAGEITSITDEVTAGLDNAIADVIEAGEAIGNLDVEFTNSKLTQKIEALQESLNSWVKDTDSTSQGFGNQETPSGPQIKVKKVKEIRTIDEYSNDTVSIEFEYNAEGKVTRMKESHIETYHSSVSRYIFDYNTLRKIYVQCQEESQFPYQSPFQNEHELSFTTNGDGKVIKILDNEESFDKEVSATYEYDSNNNLKSIKVNDGGGRVEYSFLYSNDALSAISANINYSNYQSSDSLNVAPSCPNKYASNTINMDINLYLLMPDFFRSPVMSCGPHFGKCGKYFIEKCMATIAQHDDLDQPYNDYTNNPEYEETKTEEYDKFLGPMEEFWPLNYTFDSDNCPTEIYSSMSFQTYRRTYSYKAGEGVKTYEDGTCEYPIIRELVEEIRVGEPKTLKRITTITYYEE